MATEGENLPGLRGGCAIVTGAAGGIGAAVVARLAQAGCRVLAVDQDAEGLARLAEGFDPGAVAVHQADVTQEAAVRGYVAEAVRRFGPVRAFANNAGILGRRVPIVAMELADFDAVLAVNLRGVFLGLREVMRAMIAAGSGGAIVNTSSVGALRGYPNSAAYGAAKRGVLALTATAAQEAGPHGIRVNAICPGPVDTPMLAPALASARGLSLAEGFAGQAIARPARPAEMAEFIAWLLCDAASYLTGGIYVADGGVTA